MDLHPSEVALSERQAFKRDQDGRIVLRRAFGSDALALLLSIVTPFLYGLALLLLLGLLFYFLPEGDGSVWGAS